VRSAGVAGVAAMSTVLVSRTGLDGFRAAFVVICIAAALGALTAAIALQRRVRAAEEAPLAHEPIGPQPAVVPAIDPAEQLRARGTDGTAGRRSWGDEQRSKPHRQRRHGMSEHGVGTREEWQAARDKLLEREKELTRRNDELAQERRELPWVPIEKEYSFETDKGTKTLPELFDGRSQLLIYHFMFGPAYEAGCPVCSSIADNIDPNVVHLRARDVTMICASRAPLERIQSYQQRMGWGFDWVSTHNSDFNFDFGFSYPEDQVQTFLEDGPPPVISEVSAACGTDPAGYLSEGPGLSAFALADGVVHHTYAASARGLEPVMGYYGLLDRAPMGRNEGDPPEFWLRRHDEYGR
jgi:predicted dithiol-disulfide oxidoreductase (DUF899 family)